MRNVPRHIALFMRCALLLLASALLGSSCATIRYRKDYRLKVVSPNSGARVVYKDSIYVLPASLRVRRSGADLSLQLVTDSLTKQYRVKAVPNGTFLFGNLVFMELAPAAYLIDLTTPKRFYYGATLELDICDSHTVIHPYAAKRVYRAFVRQWPVRKGDVLLQPSLCFVNDFYLRPAGEGIKAQTGFQGLGLNVGYAYREHRFISLTGSAVINFPAPVVGAYDRWGEYENISSVTLGVTDNYTLRRFTFGYGISYARHSWSLVYGHAADTSLPPPTRAPLNKSTDALGLQLSAHYLIGRLLNAGIVYRPTLLDIAPDARWTYQHTVSLDIGLRLKLPRRRRP